MLPEPKAALTILRKAVQSLRDTGCCPSPIIDVCEQQIALIEATSQPRRRRPASASRPAPSTTLPPILAEIARRGGTV